MLCKKCKKEGDFSYRNKAKNIKHRICKKCCAIYTDDFYQRNKKIHIEKNKLLIKNKREKLRFLVDELKNKPCTDCKKLYAAWIMEFDHLDPHTKFMNISTMVLKLYSFCRILEEIKKCELVCSNCHQDREHKRRTLGKMAESGLLQQS